MATLPSGKTAFAGAAGQLRDDAVVADDLFHRRKNDHFVRVSRGNDGVGVRVGIDQGLRGAVLSREFVGEQNRFDAMRLDLRAVHHEIGVGIAEALLGNDDAVGIQGNDQLGRQRGRPLFVAQGDIFVGDDAADEVPVHPVPAQEIEDDGVVLVMIRRVLVARRDAISGDDGAEQHFRGNDSPGRHLLDIHSAIVRVMQKALGLEHVQVGDSWHPFPSAGFFRTVETRIRRIVQGFEAAGGKRPVQGGSGDVIGRLETGQPDRFFVFVPFRPLFYGNIQHQVVYAGKERVPGARAGHVDEPFLKADDRSHGGHDHPAQRHDLPGRDPVGIRIPRGKHPGKDRILRDPAQAGFDDILDGNDSNRIPGSGDRQLNVFDDGIGS